MSAPFNPGRDSSAAPPSVQFGDPTPGDLTSGQDADFAKGYNSEHTNLSEVDYRDPENKP
jgi:hypothetical protein